MRLSPKSVLRAATALGIVACADAARTPESQSVEQAGHAVAPVPPPEQSIPLDDVLELHYALMRDDFAKLDICIAAEIDPTDSDVRWEVKHAPELRPFSMGGSPPLSSIGAPANPLLAGRC